MIKRVLKIIKVLIMLTGITLGFFYYKGMIKIPDLTKPKLELTGEVDNIKYITIQVGDNEFFDVAVDSTATLEYTNEDNIWKYDSVTIMRTSVPVEGHHYDKDVYYVDNTEVYRKVNDYYIVALSSKSLLAGTVEHLCSTSTYTVPSILQTECRTDEKFTADSVVDFKVINDIVVPSTYKESLIPNSDAISYFTKDGYFNAHTKYVTFEDAKNKVVSKLIAQNKESLEIYYDDSNIFVAKVFNTYVGVKNINYNTQLILSCRGNESYPFFIATLYGL